MNFFLKRILARLKVLADRSYLIFHVKYISIILSGFRCSRNSFDIEQRVTFYYSTTTTTTTTKKTVSLDLLNVVESKEIRSLAQSKQTDLVWTNKCHYLIVKNFNFK